MASNPDSKPNGIPDIMRVIGNMLRIAILEYNNKASQKELTTVLTQISGLESGNVNLQARVTNLTNDLEIAIKEWNRNYNARVQLENTNIQLVTQLQNNIDANAQLGQHLQEARKHLAAIVHENRGSQAQLGTLQQQLTQVQQQTQQQIQRLKQQLQEAQAETAAAQRQAQSAVSATNTAQNETRAVLKARDDAQTRATAAEAQARDAAQKAQLAQDTEKQARQRLTELEAQLAQLRTQQGASDEQVQGLQKQLTTAQAAAQAAAAQANQARAEATAAQTAQADAERQARDASETAQQSVIEKEAEAAQERVRLGSMVEDAERERDAERNAAAAARAQIDDAQQAVAEATARAANSAAELANLQQQLRQQMLSTEEVNNLNQRLNEANQKSKADNAAAEEANQALQRQLKAQQTEANAAAEAAASEQQNLAAQLADLQQQVGTTGTQNEDLQARIEEVERQLAEANDAAEQSKQKAEEAQQQFQTQLEQVREAAQRRVQELETQLKQAKENGNTTADQRAALEKQLHQQQEAAEEARRAQQDALERAEEAERASEHTKKQITQQKVANTFMSAALKTKANTAARAQQDATEEAARAQQEAQQKLAEQQAAVETARKEARDATQRAKAAIKEAEERATQQQSELDALREKLQTAESNGQEVDTLKQTLAQKESEVNDVKRELEAQKLAQSAAEKAAADAAEKAAADAAEITRKEMEQQILQKNNQAVITLNEANETNRKLAAEKRGIEEELRKLQEQFNQLQSEKVAASKAVQDQQNEARRQKETEINAKKGTLQASIARAKASIAKMTDKNCKDTLLKQAGELENQLSTLTTENMTSMDKPVQDLSEATGDKIKTFVSMRKEENPRSITFDKTKKTVTTPAIPAIAGGGSTKVWGPFSGVFDPDSTNEDKYQSMKTDLLDDIPSKGTTVVIFGYGYSGSGKTYTLLGGINKETKTWEDGIAQLAIKEYLDVQKCTVQMEEVFEMYNDSYTNSDGFHYGTEKPKKEDVFDSEHPLDITSTSDFDGAYSKITIKRKSKGRITATPNNPESSRGHLFIVLKVTKDGKEGRLIICDMGGRENPNEMWTTSEYVTITKKNPNEPDIKKQTYTVIRPVSKSNPEMYYDEDGTEKSIPTTNPPQKTKLQQLFGSGTSTLAMALQGSSSSPEKTMLKQGFYINDSINEMLAEFGYNSVERPSNWSRSNGIDTYNPDVRALLVAGLNKKKSGNEIVYNKENDKIGISGIFKEFRAKSKCKIKFCTFACIRSPAIFFEDSIKTLQFAEAVNSVILAAAAPSSLPAAPAAAPAADRAPSSLPAARSFGGPRYTVSQLGQNLVPNGGSIRRQRRKKHAIFKTFKKSRLGFSASDSASDSALASDSNSVKVKHKTRNKKKHNTRNNTVKK